jgi:hypothetical protein
MPNHVVLKCGEKAGEITGMLVDCDPLLSDDPILRDYRLSDDIPIPVFMAADTIRFKHDSTRPKYFRHDLESLFYLLITCSMQKRLRFSSVMDETGRRRQMWETSFFDNAFEISLLREWWTPIWKLFGDAHFSSRFGSDEPETLGGRLTFEALREAMGVEAALVEAVKPSGDRKYFPTGGIKQFSSKGNVPDSDGAQAIGEPAPHVNDVEKH